MFKTKADVIFTLMAVSIAFCIALPFVQSWLLAIPLVVLLIAMLALMSSYKSETPLPTQKKGKMFKSNLVQADFHQRPCKVYVCENEVVVTSKGISDIHIGLDRISVLLFQAKTKTDENLAGCSIDYDKNTKRLMFAGFSASHLREIITAIRDAHYKLHNGELGFLKFIDVGESATSVIHQIA